MPMLLAQFVLLFLIFIATHFQVLSNVHMIIYSCHFLDRTLDVIRLIQAMGASGYYILSLTLVVK